MKFKDINKKYIIIALIVIAGFIGVQYMAVFGSNTGIYQTDKTAFEADIGDTIIVTGSAWIDSPGSYSIDAWDPNYLYLEDLDTITAIGTGTWYFDAKIPTTKIGVYRIFLSREDSYIGDEIEITVSALGAPSAPDEPPIDEDPCQGVQCNDYCVGTTLYRDGYCVDGVCRYSKDYKSEDCGYIPPVIDPCVGVLCGDKCVGTTLYHDGQCVDGSCVFTQTAQSEQCGYVEEPPEDEEDDVLTTIMLIMALVLILLGGSYMYVKR